MLRVLITEPSVSGSGSNNDEDKRYHSARKRLANNSPPVLQQISRKILEARAASHRYLIMPDNNPVTSSG